MSAKRTLRYEPALDGLRALSVCAVILQHAYFHQVPGGWVGVDLFFVLSGFLITTLLLEERGTTGSISLPKFYLRRIFRLWPAFAVFLAVYFAMSVVTTNGVGRSTWFTQGAIAGTYWFNIYMAGHPAAVGSISHTWTLALEEQFYVVWPVLLIVAARLRFSRRQLAALTVVLIGACFAWRLHLYAGGASWQRMVYPPDTRATSLLLGCLAGQIYMARAVFAPRVMRVLRVWAIAFVPVLAVVVFTVNPEWRWVYAGVLDLVSITAAGGILGLLVARPPRVQALLSHPVLVTVGRLSYALYLWHVLILQTAVTHYQRHHPIVVAVAVALSFGAAALSRVAVEQPFLRLKQRFSGTPAVHEPAVQPVVVG